MTILASTVSFVTIFYADWVRMTCLLCCYIFTNHANRLHWAKNKTGGFMNTQRRSKGNITRSACYRHSARFAWSCFFFLAWDVRIHRKGCPLLRLLSRRAFVECDCFWIAKCFDCRREQAWRRHDQMPCPRSRRVYLAVRQRFLWYFYPLWSIHINDWVCCTNDSVIYIYVEFIVFLHNQLQVVCCHSLRASSAWVSIVKSLSSQWLQ